jgi:hypothetical protein
VTRCLYNPNRERFQPGNGAPQGHHKAAQDARQQLGEFLDANLTRPLHNTASQNDARVERELNGMSQAARVFAELEMQDRTKAVHSWQYDPLAR